MGRPSEGRSGSDYTPAFSKKGIDLSLVSKIIIDYDNRMIKTLGQYLNRSGDRTRDAEIVRDFCLDFGVSVSTVYRLLSEESSFVYKTPEGSFLLLRKAAECDSIS